MFPFYKLLMLLEITSFLYFFKLVFYLSFIEVNNDLLLNHKLWKYPFPRKSPGKNGKEELGLHLKFTSFRLIRLQ